MTDQTTFIQPADRIAPFKPYFFAALSKKLAVLKENGLDIIRIDMGSPDLPPTDFIVDQLTLSAKSKSKHGYSPNGGTQDYKQAIAQYYQTRFNVNLDPQTETLALIGSKEGLFHLAQVLLNPGDLALIPDPGYPVYTSGTLIAGGKIYKMPLLEKNNFLPDLDAIPSEIADQAKLLWVNYPNNPTGAVADLSFFEKLINFAKKHQIFVAHDAPYVDICFDGYNAPSILQVPGAKQVCIEFNSLSKTYNMAGWRLGMAVGNAQVIKLIHTYKSQLDSSHFEPMLDAGIAALTGDQTWIIGRNKIYEERRNIIVDGLKESGFILTTPPAAIYVWAKLPQRFTDSAQFCNQLLEDTGVSTTPGIVYGEYGEGYLRISLGTDTERIREAVHRIKNWIKQQ